MPSMPRGARVYRDANPGSGSPGNEERSMICDSCRRFGKEHIHLAGHPGNCQCTGASYITAFMDESDRFTVLMREAQDEVVEKMGDYSGDNVPRWTKPIKSRWATQ
jgi:hypothetical protein